MILSPRIPIVELPWLTGTSMVAAVAYLWVIWRGQRGRASGVLWGAWMVHGVAIVVDTVGWGQAIAGARFGFAPALSVTCWLVLAVYLIESRTLPMDSMRRGLAGLCTAAVGLAAWYPGELHPMAGSPWAPLHWVMGIASYGLFGVAVLHAAMLGAAERQLRPSRGGVAPASDVVHAPVGLPVMRLEKMTFRFVRAGFVVLTLAIALGVVFAHPWRWDHKSVFSILSWLVFAGLLLGRHRFGWRGRKATRWLYGGTALLLLAYVGFRFVLEVLLQRTTSH